LFGSLNATISGIVVYTILKFTGNSDGPLSRKLQFHSQQHETDLAHVVCSIVGLSIFEVEIEVAQEEIKLLG